MLAVLNYNAEVTVAQKPNHGTNRKKGCNLFPGAFFVSPMFVNGEN